jgi:hypothetical protein
MNAFDKLTFEAKAELLRSEGEPIITTAFFNYYVTLYCINGFLAERYYNTETKVTARISSVECKDIDKYLQQININELYSLFL